MKLGEMKKKTQKTPPQIIIKILSNIDTFGPIFQRRLVYVKHTYLRAAWSEFIDDSAYKCMKVFNNKKKYCLLSISFCEQTVTGELANASNLID